MPFIGQDWRSPGEVWIKTDEGWERMTLIRKSHLLRSQHSYDSKKPETSSSLSVRAASSSSLVSSTSSSCSDSEIDLDGRGNSSESISPSSTPSTSASSSPGPDITLPSAIAAAAAAEAQNTNGNSKKEYSVVEIIERLAKSSSHPIPDAILRESSHAIETHHLQPFCRVLLAPTKEVVGSNIISEAFFKLDFCNAIRDIRRFPYVSKLLHLLIKQNLTTLSGNATKALFWMLEEIAKQVAQNKQNIHVVRELIQELNEIVQKYMCWGRPLGSTILWEQHLKTLERICELTDSIELGEQFDSSTLLFNDLGFDFTSRASWNSLPEELIREILLRIADYKDLGRTAEACRRVHVMLSEEQHIWRQLCKYHFSKDQLKWASREIKHDPNDWQATFHALRKKFGLKEEYPDCLFLCRYCRCLFWRSKGHPCALDNPDLTTQLTDNVSNTESRSKSEIMASLKEKFSEMSTKVRSNSGSSSSSPGTSPPSTSGNLNSQSNTSSNSNRPPQSSSPNSGRSQQYQRSAQNPVVVQNVPFFDHPLVLAQRRQNDQNEQQQEQQQQQQQEPQQQQQQQSNASNRQPFDRIRQRFQNPANASRQNDNRNDNNDKSAYQKAPLYVPITPHEFLKFFSL